MAKLRRRTLRSATKHPGFRPRVRHLEDRITPDATPHNLAAGNLYQSWNISGQITTDDDWSGVPSITGYLGDDTIGEGVDPQTVVVPYATVDLIAIGGNPTLSTGGVARFGNFAYKQTVALQADAMTDAPNLVVFLDTMGKSRISLSYNLRDIDDTADNAVQPVALQYRIGNAGNFINIPAGFVADATSGPNLGTKVTPVNVLLPSAADNQAQVQVRFITTNAVGNDEWVGVDDIQVNVLGNEVPINTTTNGDQFDPAVAMHANGNAFVAWREGNSGVIWGQRLSAAGTKVGDEFTISTISNYGSKPSVALDSDGDALVVWVGYGQDGDVDSIVGQRFNSAGAKVGGEFLINTYTTGSQLYPSVALDADGDALVVWDSKGLDGSDWAIVGQRLDSAGAKVGGEFVINTFTTGPQRTPSVAVDADGDALVVWQTEPQVGTDYGISGQRLNAAGNKVGGEFLINTYTTDNQRYPSVAVDADGDAVVVWSSYGQDGSGYGIFGQRFNSAGTKVGGEFQINTYTTGEQNDASVAVDADGDAVVAWTSHDQDGSGRGVFSQRFNSLGIKHGGEFPINVYTTSDQIQTRVALDADGDTLVVWSSNEQDGSGFGVYGRHFRSPNPDIMPHNLAASNYYQNWNNGSLLTANDDWSGVPSVLAFLGDDTIGTGVDPQTILTPYGDIDVLANQGSNTALTTGGVAEFDGLANRVVALQPDGTAAAPNLVIYLNTIGVSRVAITYNLRDMDGTADDAVQPVALQYRIGSTGDFVNVPSGFVADATTGPNLATKVTPVSAILPVFVANQPLVQVRIITTNAAGNDEWVGVDDIVIRSEFVVNTGTVSSQQNPSVAMDADGDVMVVWEDRRNYATDIYYQRFNAAGAKVGGEILVNTYTTNFQINPSVAIDADGDAVVVWQSNGPDGSGYGIFGQRFDSAGAKVGGEFQINTYTTGTQRFPSVAMDADGDVMVVWNSQGQGGPEGVIGQRFDSAGAKVGGEVQISTYAFGGNFNPSVAMDAGGNATVVWHSSQGGPTGIYGQRYDPAGAKVGGEYQINTVTADQRIRASVALDNDGDAMVVWQAIQDGDIYGIYGQRFNSAGAKVGGEFQINTYTTSFQNYAAVAMDDDGDAVVTWDSNLQDGGNYGVYGQRFNSAGAKVGGEFPVNIYTTSNQRSSAVAMDADGDVMVVWHSYITGGASYEVYGQRFAKPETPAFVTNVLVNHAAPGAQRSMVTSLQVTFDSKVSFSGGPESAFTLVNQKTTNAVVLSASVDLSGTVVTLTFTGGSVDLGGSLSDGRYTLSILANQVSANGFDGNGDGVDGDDYVLVGTPTNGLFRIFGDITGDGSVAANDFIVFRQFFNGVNAAFDFNNDGSVSASDFIQFRQRFNGSI